MTKTLTLVRLDESIVDVVGYRYVFRAHSTDGYDRHIFSLSIQELLGKVSWDSAINWEEVEGALGKCRCWKKVTDS